MPAKKTSRSLDAGRFSIGRDGMDKINAVEGIQRRVESRLMFADFDKHGLSLEQRRLAIIAAHAKKV